MITFGIGQMPYGCICKAWQLLNGNAERLFSIKIGGWHAWQKTERGSGFSTGFAIPPLIHLAPTGNAIRNRTGNKTPHMHTIWSRAYKIKIWSARSWPWHSS